MKVLLEEQPINKSLQAFVIYKSNKSNSKVKILACSATAFKKANVINNNIEILDCINAENKFDALNKYMFNN